MYDNQLAINIYMKTPQGYDGCVLKPHTSPECPTSIRNNIATYVGTGRRDGFDYLVAKAISYDGM